VSDENVEREKAWSEFVSNNGLTYAAEQQLRVAFIGGWVRGRASRPREAGKVRVVCEVCDGKGTIAIVDHYDDKGESVYAPDECPECEGRLYVERTAYVAAPVAPEACPRCGSKDRRVRKCGFDGHATVHDVPVGPYGSGGIRPNECVSCRDPWHGALLTEGSHPMGPVENCPCHLCRFAFADDAHATPAPRAAGREGAVEKARGFIVSAAVAWLYAQALPQDSTARACSDAGLAGAVAAYLRAAEAEGGGE
jgi:hypothetical protein